MDRIATENLFLLEFLVDRVALDPNCACDAPPCDTCISFQFLDNEPLNVCEEDFQPKTQYNRNNRTLKSGKSCLFSLTPEQAEAAVDDFDVCVNVYKKMPEGWLPEKVNIGTTVISIAQLFTDLIDAVTNSDGNTPSSKTFKDIFDVLNDSEECVGKISVYIRMSCFGKLIVTQFQMNTEDKSVLFKDQEGKSMYRYKKTEDKLKNCAMNNNILCPDEPCDRAGYSGGQFPPQSAVLGGMYGVCPPQLQPQPQPQVPSLPAYPMMGGYGMGMGSPNSMVPCNECGGFTPLPTPSAQVQSPVQQSPPGNYQEIGASMGNNSLTIRVHKDNKIENVSNEGDTAGTFYPISNTQQNCKEQNLMMQGNRNPFNLKVGDCGKGQNNNNVIVNPPVCTAKDGTQFTEISDPDKELFLLRIGKKSEGVNKKANLELELCTPKAPPFKPKPKKETRDTQYDEKDAGEVGSDKKKGGKGKGGKGKGKGKKK